MRGARLATSGCLLVALWLVGSPLFARAQESTRVARIGYLAPGVAASPQQRASLDAFRQGLRERGYVEGENLIIEYRYADGKLDELSRLAAELVHKNVALIVTGSTPAALAAKRATDTIPIVVYAMGDPVGDGLVTSLARPGGNVTGSTFLGPGLVPKRLELIKETLPRLTRVAVLWHPGAFSARTMREMLDESEAAARGLGMRLHLVEARTAADLEGAFAVMMRAHAEAVLVFPSVMFFIERHRIATLVTHHRLPSIFAAVEFVELGGLLSYGASISDLTRRAAIHIERILAGAKAADLPVEQPTKLDLAVNLATARSLGVAIPASVLLRADRVIE